MHNDNDCQTKLQCHSHPCPACVRDLSSDRNKGTLENALFMVQGDYFSDVCCFKAHDGNRVDPKYTGVVLPHNLIVQFE